MSAPDAPQFWVLAGDTPSGPHPADAVRARLAAGEFTVATNACRVGDTAWQPLAATLDSDQKRRMRILGFLVLNEMRDAIDNHRAMQEDEEEMED